MKETKTSKYVDIQIERQIDRHRDEKDKERKKRGRDERANEQEKTMHHKSAPRLSNVYVWQLH